jgi:hypothetical protein
MTSTRIRTYSELIRLRTIEDRYNYLQLRGVVAQETFGFDRFISQAFYHSREWKRLRHQIILRDNGCDLGVDDYLIHGHILIHHMNPMMPVDITRGEAGILDPEYLITTTLRTHNAIHYGDRSQLPRELVPRRAGDTKLW